MAPHHLRLATPRPFFAEIPYYVWGQVNYDSEGDCRVPADRSWTWLVLTHRDTGERLEIEGRGEELIIDGPEPAADRAAHFLVHRCSAIHVSGPEPSLGEGWDHAGAAARAARVVAVFERPELEPFRRDTLFWGSWKWVGWFATAFTWVGRWIMEALLSDDPRGVNLCAFWLQEGAEDSQVAALCYALERLTGLSFATGEEWVKWYFEGPGAELYPEPDFERWKKDLEAAYPEMA